MPLGFLLLPRAGWIGMNISRLLALQGMLQHAHTALRKERRCQGTHCPQSPLPPPSAPPGFLTHKPQPSFFFPPICSALRTKPAGERGLGAWRPASREAAAASAAPTFAAESADGARLASPWRRAPAGSRVPRPHPSARPAAAEPPPHGSGAAGLCRCPARGLLGSSAL